MRSRVGSDIRSQNPVSAVTLTFLTLSAIWVTAVVGASEAKMPTYSVGDKWKYHVDYKYEIGMIGTFTMEVLTDSVEVTQFGQSYTCYKLGLTGGGTVYGQGLSGSWTIDGELYVQMSDLSEVKYKATTEATFTVEWESATMRQTLETKYNPPLESSKGFPITAGESWSATSTQTTTTETTLDGLDDEETDTETQTKQFLVTKTETVTVTAGEFDTFVIRATDPDGSYTELWHSPKVGYSVKERQYDGTGELTFTAELLEYRYAGAGEGSWILLLVGILIAAGVLIGAVVYVALPRGRKPMPPVVPSAPTTE